MPFSQAEIQAIVKVGKSGKSKVVPPAACAPLPSGIVDWYTADGNANGSIGKSTLQNGATFASGEVGMAFSLNGTNQFASLPVNFIPYPANGVTSTAPMSVDAWFLTTKGGVILGQQGGVSPPIVPASATPGIYVGMDGFLYVELFWKGTLAPIASVSKVNDGAFHHVAVTYDGTTEDVYLDGALIGSTPLVQTGYASSYQYQIGVGYTAAGWPGGNGGYFYFQGLIDEVQFFNRALSQAEVLSIVHAGSAGTCKNDVPVAICRNVTVPAGPGGTAPASVNNGSFDPVLGRRHQSNLDRNRQSRSFEPVHRYGHGYQHDAANGLQTNCDAELLMAAESQDDSRDHNGNRLRQLQSGLLPHRLRQ